MKIKPKIIVYCNENCTILKTCLDFVTLDSTLSLPYYLILRTTNYSSYYYLHIIFTMVNSAPKFSIKLRKRFIIFPILYFPVMYTYELYRCVLSGLNFGGHANLFTWRLIYVCGVGIKHLVNHVFGR